ncbi:hypothetical protein PTKIN_Ptkin13bG0182000 [Pterospermum kingtungense]
MIAAGWCHPNRDRQGQGPQQDQGQEHHHSLRHEILEMSSLENSTAQLIPARKYQKGIGFGFGLVDDDDDGICAVCLSEFEEGEEVRTLPECLHTFHAPCIDMWLYSHTSCPMCRADATPSSQVPDRRPLDSGISPPDSRSVRLNAGIMQLPSKRSYGCNY